jgi:hypothetical protein
MKFRFAHFAIAVSLSLLPFSAAADDLDGLAGAWAGIGLMKPADGPREKVRCKVTYKVVKPNRFIDLDLLCASDAYKMNLQANIERKGQEIFGNWFEREYRQGGKIVGTNKDGLIEARIEGNTVAALIAIRTTGDRQEFSMEAPGSWMEEVTIDLARNTR